MVFNTPTGGGSISVAKWLAHLTRQPGVKVAQVAPHMYVKHYGSRSRAQVNTCKGIIPFECLEVTVKRLLCTSLSTV